MLINYESLKTAFEGFRALYQQSWAKVQPKWNQIAMEAPSTGYQETYEWLGDVPQMREWLGERLVKNLKGQKYTIVNKDYESTIAVDRNHFEDDKLGIYNTRVQDLPFAYTRHLDRITFELLKNGFATVGYDGSYFFVATHSESGSNQSNLSVSALSQEALETGFQAMASFTSDSGEALGIEPDTLVVHPTQKLFAMKLVGSLTTMVTQQITATTTFATTGTLNALSTFGIQVIASPHVGSNDWFLLCTQYPVKPLIVQIRRQPEFNMLNDPKSSESVFMQKRYLFGIDARYNAGYGLWQLAYGSTGGS
jgi:phage major head subunit gpT-like protein